MIAWIDGKRSAKRRKEKKLQKELEMQLNNSIITKHKESKNAKV